MRQTAKPVQRRHVLYIPGYDPFPPRRYRELYRAEGRDQAVISGYELDIRARPGAERFGWEARLIAGGTASSATFEVLVWADIVQGSMARSIPATYLQLARTAWTYITSGALWRLMRLRQGPIIAALYPVVFLLVQLVLAALVALGMWWFGKALLPAPWGGWLGAIAGAGFGYALLDLFRRWDNKFFAYYLMHDYAYSARFKGANPPELEARMGEFADAVRAALASDVDEVLVVGHSSGAHLAVSILADVLRDEPPEGAVLSLLTLGQVVPMVSFLPRANRLRRDLAEVSRDDRLTWVDVTAPGDGCAFALCDPVAVSGVAPAGKIWPLVISAAFTQTLSAIRYKELRRRYFRLHFQYLCAFDRPGDYDYFQITAGAQTLGARYTGRSPSPSRIEAPVNKFTGMAP